MNTKVKTITRLAIVAALYVVLTVLIQPLSYGMMQFRVSEILVLLCFYRKDYSIALIVGTFIANFFSPTALYDVPFGTVATALAVVGVMLSKKKYIAIIYPVISNALIVGLMLAIAYKEPFFINALWVGLGEAGVMVVGLIIFTLLERNKHFYTIVDANQNIKIKEVQ